MGDNAAELDRLTQLKDDWTAINAAIGSDGKTLRKIAQCYTLSFLVEHANAEIRKFNSRYELVQVKNSLGLRVIDHDRADDVRDTTSLSGGETFIVSLGLALGLSSLSSRTNSCENLFIDEGFGTLDADTLAVVVDSLAMLQSNQGKKGRYQPHRHLDVRRAYHYTNPHRQKRQLGQQPHRVLSLILHKKPPNRRLFFFFCLSYKKNPYLCRLIKSKRHVT